MTSQENRLNDALRHLGEEFRLGMVSPDEYRVRRRLLLESWGERDVTTSPSSLKRSSGTTAPNPTAPRAPASAARAKAAPVARAPFGWMLVMVLLLALAGGLYLLLAPPRAASPGAQVASASAAPARSAGVVALTHSAVEFLDRNRWEAADLDAFSRQWRALPEAERHAARQEPAIRSLRHELEQNIRSETLALSASADPEQRGRLDGLLQFAKELDGPL